MAFTDVDAARAFDAVNRANSGEELYKLGLMYSTGQGVGADYVQAHMWFNLAALKGFDEAKTHRRELASLMSSTEVAAAQRAAREWLNKGN